MPRASSQTFDQKRPFKSGTTGFHKITVHVGLTGPGWQRGHQAVVRPPIVARLKRNADGADRRRSLSSADESAMTRRIGVVVANDAEGFARNKAGRATERSCCFG